MIRLYIVEDDRMIREGLREVFPWDNYGIEIIGDSDNGKTAYQEVVQKSVDILLTDVVLPGMTGIDLAVKLREDGWKGEIIMMSAYQDVAYLRAALKTQSVDFLFKPMKMDELKDTVRRAIVRVDEHKATIAYDENVWSELLKRELDKADIDGLKPLFQEIWEKISVDNPIQTELLARLKCFEALLIAQLPLKAVYEVMGHFEEKMNENAEIAYVEMSNSIAEWLKNNLLEWKFANRVIEWINDNLIDADAETIAAYMHMSRANFYRQYSRIFEENLNDMISRLRIEKASVLLRKSDLKIYEVADRVGYNDVEYFSKVFRRVTGLTPNKFRQVLHED